jgi:hypothetical protein
MVLASVWPMPGWIATPDRSLTAMGRVALKGGT